MHASRLLASRLSHVVKATAAAECAEEKTDLTQQF